MTFADLNLNTPLLKTLDELGYTKPTVIQEKVFPVIMAGRDVLGIAQTGTGKTFAYLLPALRQWTYAKDRHPQILVVVPTRELAVQVANEAQKLSAKLTAQTVAAYGGTNIKTQIEAIEAGCDVLVATPGRLLDLALHGTLRLKNIKKLVIDEVDEMLNLGFRAQLTRVLDLLPPKRQNLLFSATLTDEVETFIEANFTAPEKIEAAPVGTPLENIAQSAWCVPNFFTKINLLALLLKQQDDMQKVLVFTATKHLADQVYNHIAEKFPEQIGVVHSNKDQNYRFNAVRRFRTGEFRVLIATDLIARGIDINEVSHVINFDMPEIPENYIHRIGRTGRAESKGIAISFITPRETEEREAIENLMNYVIPENAIPENLIISEVLTEEERPGFKMKTIDVKLPSRADAGAAFHEKKDKNKKVNQKKTRAQLMKEKYKKPKTRGQKKG